MSLGSSALIAFGRPRLNRGDCQVIVRLAILAVLVLLYFVSDWTPLRLAVRDAVVPPLYLLGHSVDMLELGTDLLLVFGSGHGFAIEASCTYSDLALVLAPFVWRFRLRLSSNLTRIAGVFAGVFVVNTVRVILALHLFENGISWQLAHRYPDLLIHVAAIGIAVVLAVRADLCPDSQNCHNRA